MGGKIPPMRVLVVDDSPIITTYVAALLQLDADVTTMHRGYAALMNPAHPLWQQVDVLVCDLKMPEVYGLDIVRIAVDYHPRIRCVILSGAQDAELADAARYGVVVDKDAPIPVVIEAILG